MTRKWKGRTFFLKANLFSLIFFLIWHIKHFSSFDFLMLYKRNNKKRKRGQSKRVLCTFIYWPIVNDQVANYVFDFVWLSSWLHDVWLNWRTNIFLIDVTFGCEVTFRPPHLLNTKSISAVLIRLVSQIKITLLLKMH